VVNVQGDEPLVDPKLVARLAATMIADRKIDMITAATLFGADEDVANPNAVKVVTDRHGDALYFSRSTIPYLRGDGVRPAWWRHLGIYGYTTKFLLQFVQWKPSPLELAESLEQLRALENGARIRVLSTKHAAIGVDTPADVAVAEELLVQKAGPKRRNR
jgi:3-deoxy-manno-octulosonate cytidylyltransferase (CMP-KDO synthetase)